MVKYQEASRLVKVIYDYQTGKYLIPDWNNNKKLPQTLITCQIQYQKQKRIK